MSDRRERTPSFDDLEPPALLEAPFNGLTDAQWVARRERAERVFRIACGVIFGGVVAMLSIWHWGALRSRSNLGSLLVIAGSMLLFATLFAQRRDDEALGHAAWIVFPEWALVERLPLWALLLILVGGVAVLFALAVVIFVAHLR